jgi:hypothetical protein
METTEGVTSATYYFLVDDGSEAHTIASTEALSPQEALARLQPWYEPYRFTGLRNFQEDS